MCYVDTGCAAAGILPNRGPFALPRVNVAWDIDGKGNNVLRGGYGLFYNRNMGNVEYDNTLRLAPERLSASTPTSGPAAATATGSGLTYDTVHEATLANRIGSIGDQHARPELVQVAEDAQLQPLVRAADLRSTRWSRRATSAPAAATW